MAKYKTQGNSFVPDSLILIPDSWEQCASFSHKQIVFRQSELETSFLNLLKPTGYEMHQQFNIQQLYALPTLYLCVFYLSGNKQRLVPLTA